MNITPIFVGGCDRSGTTMLGDMLGAGEFLFSTPESHFFHELAYGQFLGRFKSRTDIADWLLSDFRFATWKLNISYSRLCEVISLENVRETIQGIIRLYMEDNNISNSKIFWVDHTPDNAKNYSLLGMIFPDAKFVHIVRDGRGVASSLVPLKWGPNNYFMASRYWYERVRQGIMMELQFQKRCVRMKFEDIMKNDEGALTDICYRLDIKYDKKMLNGGGLILPEFTKDQHKLVGGRVDPTRANSWMYSMSSGEKRDFFSYEKSLFLLQYFGYDVSDIDVCSNMRKGWLYVSDSVKTIINKRTEHISNKNEIKTYNLMISK